MHRFISTVFTTGDACTFVTGYNCTFITASDCLFDSGSNCNFITGDNCTFTTGNYAIIRCGHCSIIYCGCNSVVIRTDVFDILVFEDAVTYLRLNDYEVKGFTILADKHTIVIDGTDVEVSTKVYTQIKDLHRFISTV